MNLSHWACNSIDPTLSFNEKTDSNELNIYSPPSWKKDHFFLKKPLPVVDTLPIQYTWFFDHLFAGDKESIAYAINWIAAGLKQKQICTLALVGTKQGIGKNVLAEILKQLHGKSNSNLFGQSILSKEFNSGMSSRTFAHIDEVVIKDESGYNAFKQYSNSEISIEGKGSNSEMQLFFASILWTNNNKDSLKCVDPKSERRFSIPILTDEKLLGSKYFPDEASINELHENGALIEKLALYLMNFNSTNNTKNLKTSHYHEIIRSSQPDWHIRITSLLREYGTQQGYGLLFIQAFLKKQGMYRPPSCEKIEAFILNDPEMAVRQRQNTKYLLFKHDDETAGDFAKRLKQHNDLPIRTKITNNF